MIKKLALSASLALSVAAGPATAASVYGEVTNYDFSWQGPFGSYDQQQLQRGLQVYTEACAACHGLRYVPIRTLSDSSGPGLPEDQVRAYASRFDVWDPQERGFREAGPNDHFPESQLEEAPDLSLMAKARAGFSGPYGLGINQLLKGTGGPEYIASLLMGYTGETDTQAGVTLHENTAYGGYLNMAPPLSAGMIEYADGTEATEEQMAKDVAAFLMWTAEPKMMERKQAGFIGVLFLGLLTVLLYLTNKRIWAPVKASAKKKD